MKCVGFVRGLKGRGGFVGIVLYGYSFRGCFFVVGFGCRSILCGVI